MFGWSGKREEWSEAEEHISGGSSNNVVVVRREGRPRGQINDWKIPDEFKAWPVVD